ncbi:DUF1304 domain-containing protein [Leptospira adleri]|uniref:DUF1304 domain-containing protein n=1 Tax=Leptospira adleri TaxID=2023186 RepID=A0A2M9YP20_9LEPT|nr:DUF1304 domain-containing protein [Leptospira adleri]PJZ53284.1 hypothetical protein CH380_10785 [Leptospira adleri]PJZ63908.1 hypothetical protein CH376_00325 [Leptospira adleri]
MKLTQTILVVFVAVEHILFLVLEMFLWETPFVLRLFNMTPEVANVSAKLAMNQGLYNGFLSAGLFWGTFFVTDKRQKNDTVLFFLGCIVVAGIFGSATAKFSILFTQGLPAALALILTMLNREK